jgi:quercetin dioxygenase-like cupin family protein
MSDPVTEAFGPDAIHHHFAGGVYAKETRIPAGGFVVSHSHPYEHMSILASGEVMIQAESPPLPIEYLLRGPAVVKIKKGVHHRITALTDAVWYCIHATDETEADLVDAAILAKEI